MHWRHANGHSDASNLNCPSAKIHRVFRESKSCRWSATRFDTVMRSMAGRCIPVRYDTDARNTSGWTRSARHLHHAVLGYVAVCAATNRRPPGLPYRSWTRLYAAGLCRARNSAHARARPQHRQRQRRFAWSTFRSLGVRKWPLPQILGMAIGSRLRSTEKHTTSLLVASKHAPATTFSGLHRRAPDCLAGPPLFPAPSDRAAAALGSSC